MAIGLVPSFARAKDVALSNERQAKSQSRTAANEIHVTLSTGLIRVSAVIFAVIGLGYLVAPSAMLSVVGIRGAPAADFLMRTEGVALLTAAGFLWAVRAWHRPPAPHGPGLACAYYVVGSLVDLTAFNDNIAGPAAVPSALISDRCRRPLRRSRLARSFTLTSPGLAVAQTPQPATCASARRSARKMRSASLGARSAARA